MVIRFRVPWRVLVERVGGNVETQAGIQLGVDAARFLDQIDAARDGAVARGVKLCCLFADETIFVSIQDRLIERHPAERAAVLNDFVEAAMFAFAKRNRFARPQVVAENLAEQLASTTFFGRESLADDVTQGVGQPNAELLLFAKRKQTKDTVD